MPELLLSVLILVVVVLSGVVGWLWHRTGQAAPAPPARQAQHPPSAQQAPPPQRPLPRTNPYGELED